MFVIDVTFAGEGRATETVFVRRPSVLIGAGDDAQVTLDELAPLGFDLIVQREAGEAFRVLPRGGSSKEVPTWIGGVFEGFAEIKLGDVALGITALDLDLVPRESEALDRAGIRIARRAFADHVPEFPAVMITNPFRAIVSFAPDQPMIIGRARQSGVRIDLTTVSSQHARIGFESGEFWIEDLGSTNGTFVGDKQVSGRVTVHPGVPIHIGTNATIVGIVSEEQIQSLDAGGARRNVSAEPERHFPCLVSLSEAARPSRVALKRGASIVIGRDPSSEMWLGAPHVSRKHCVVAVSPSGEVTITDSSTNGTAFDGGLLRSSESFATSSQPLVLDFGAGLTVGMCFSAQQEDQFKESQGAPTTFAPRERSTGGAGKRGAVSKRERRTTTWFNLQSLEGAPAQRKGLVSSLKLLFERLTLVGRIAMILVACGAVGLLVILGSMVVAGFNR